MKVIPMIGFVILSVLAVLSVISLVYGVDSREGSMDPHRPIYPVGLR
jgi:hypothetical protein